MAWPSPRRTSPRALTSSGTRLSAPRWSCSQGTRAAIRPLPRPPHEGDGALREEEAGGGDGRVALRGVLHQGRLAVCGERGQALLFVRQAHRQRGQRLDG